MTIVRPTISAVTESAPGCPTTASAVQADLGWALGVVLRSYLRAADAVLADVPGGARGYRLLSAVARDCPGSQLALAQAVGLDRTVVTYLLDDLAAAGLLERQADPADRRTRRVVATAAGQARLCEADGRLGRVEENLLGELRGEEAEMFRRMLQRVAVRAHGQTGEALTCNGIEAMAGS